MATSSIRPEKGSWAIYFRYGGRQVHKSLRIPVGTIPKEQADSRKRAELEQARVDLVLDELERGRKTLPEGADLWEFIRSDGQRTSKPQLLTPLTLGKMFEAYLVALPEGAKEQNTLDTEHIHERHLLRVLGTSRTLTGIGRTELQEYVNKRVKEGVGRETIKKELATLRMVWNRSPAAPVSYPKLDRSQSLVFPKGKEKPPFRTWDEIEAKVKRDKLTGKAAAALWESVYLTTEQVAEVLEFARTRKTRNPYWHPLLVFVAHTGARRSEAARSKVEDVRFDEGVVVLREKKRDRSKDETTRAVDLSPVLRRVLSEWFAGGHPGGRFTFCFTADQGLSPKSLDECWDWFFRECKWSVLAGFHVFRHSFASNLAAAGEDQRTIDAYMGHETEAMRKRYSHLFPAKRRKAITTLYGEA
jgi:integrase